MASAFAVAQSATHSVRIYPSEYDAQVVSQIQSSGYDDRLACDWPNNLLISDELTESDLIVIGVSSAGLNWALDVAQKLLQKKSCPVLLLTKGLMATDKGLIPLTSYVSHKIKVPSFAITGPCIAKDLAQGMPTSVEISGADFAVAKQLARLLELPFYTVYANADYVGCQWAAALKNVYAIRVGMANGLNARSAHYAESLQEMATFIQRNGGEADTVMGLSGAGDLYVTSLGGRNGKFGGYLGEGMSARDILSGPMKQVTVEGYELANLLKSYADRQTEPLFCALIECFD